MCIHSPVSPLFPVYRHLTVPLAVSERLFRLHWLLPIYFLFAVAYDIFQSILEITENMSLVLHTNSSLGWESWDWISGGAKCCWDASGMNSYYLTLCQWAKPNTHITANVFTTIDDSASIAHTDHRTSLGQWRLTRKIYSCSSGKTTLHSRMLRIYFISPTSF